MDADRWPANMRGHHLANAAREAYWEVSDRETAVVDPYFKAFIGVTASVLVNLLAGWWGIAAYAPAAMCCLLMHRRSVAARPALRDAKDRLQSIKAKGGRVCL